MSTYQQRGLYVLFACCVAVVIGSIGPWASVAFITVNGTSGDGKITLFLGLIAGVLAIIEYLRDTSSVLRIVGMMALFGVTATIGAYDWFSLEAAVREADSTLFTPSVEWGLPLMTLGAIVGIGAGLFQTKHMRSSNTTDAVSDDVTPATTTMTGDEEQVELG